MAQANSTGREGHYPYFMELELTDKEIDQFKTKLTFARLETEQHLKEQSNKILQRVMA